MGIRSKSKVVGWIEVIVRDKNGKIKYYLGPNPEKYKKEVEEDDPPIAGIPSSFPSEFIKYYWRKNIITDAGLAAIVRLVFEGLTETKFGYLAIGIGTTPESPSDTALENEIARKAATVQQVTTSVNGDTALVSATFSKSDGLTGTSNVSEAGIFNAGSGGILLCRKVFDAVPINWDAGDSLTINYYVQFSR